MDRTLSDIREIQDSDREELRAFCVSRAYAASAFASPEESKRITLATFDQNLEAVLTQPGLFAFALLEQERIVGLVIGSENQIESITKDRQTEILSLAVSDQEGFDSLLRVAAQRACEAGDRYLVFHTLESQQDEKTWAESFGMKTELFRTFMSVSAGETFERHPDYLLRRAEEHEMLFIMHVVSDHSPAYIPAHRKVNKLEIQAGFVNSYTTLHSNDKKKVPLVLERRSTGDLVGYMILVPGRMFGGIGPLSMYLYDIAVGARGQGSGLSRWMALGSKQLMSKMGGGFLYGDVSPDNRLALSATLALGSRIDSRRWGYKLI